MRYGVERPLLNYARLAVTRRGAVAHDLRWTVPSFSGTEDQRQWVNEQVAKALEQVMCGFGGATSVTGRAGPLPLIIAKSMGSLAAPIVADRGLAAIWLTPLLGDDPTVASLRAATGPALLVGGTADSQWDGDIARSITPHVLEVDNADHSMLVPGPLAASADVLGRVSTAIEGFIDHVVWA
jgi:hypothetical protein